MNVNGVSLTVIPDPSVGTGRLRVIATKTKCTLIIATAQDMKCGLSLSMSATEKHSSRWMAKTNVGHEKEGAFIWKFVRWMAATFASDGFPRMEALPATGSKSYKKTRKTNVQRMLIIRSREKFSKCTIVIVPRPKLPPIGTDTDNNLCAANAWQGCKSTCPF